MTKLKVPVTTADHIAGGEEAAVTLVEYGDYECPHCGAAHPTVQRLRKKFGKHLRFVFRNFPLNQIHPMAQSAAEAAEFAGAGGRFWEMHDGIFEHQDQIGEELLLELADAIGLSAADLSTALETEAFTPRSARTFSAACAAASTARPPSSSTACGTMGRRNMTNWPKRSSFR